MYRGEQVQEWIKWSRESLSETGDYPMLNVAEITGTSCPWQEGIYSDFTDSDKGSRDKLLTLFENHLSRDPADVSSRFTALNLHYALSTHANDDSEMQTYYDVTGVDHEDVREDFARNLAYLVRLLPVENCADWRTIRWEICNACAIRDWGRARQLHDRLEALDLREPAERQVLRGQFNFLVAFGSKTGWDFDPQYWEPKLYDSELYGYLDREGNLAPEFFLFIWGIGLARKRKEDEKEIPLDEANRDRISDAANDFEKGLSKCPDLSPAYRSMLAGCYFAKGDFANAAKNYEQVLVDSNSKFSVIEDFKIDIFKCIANSYRLAGETEKARDALKRCAAEFPSAAGIYKELAEYQAQEVEYRLAYESLKKEYERDPAFGENWLVSTLLALGSVGPDSEQIATRVERHLDSNPQLYEGIKSLLNAHWPSLDDLTPEAQGKWISGSCMTLTFPVDELLRLQMAQAAVIQFGTAVELELKSKVFGKFRDEVSRSPDLRSLVKNKRSWGEDERFFQFLVSKRPRVTLGQMHHFLKDSQDSEREIWRKFNRWVREKRLPLLKTKNLRVLGKISRIHNRAKHGESISKENAVNMPNLCRDFLSALLPSPKHGTS